MLEPQQFGKGGAILLFLLLLIGDFISHQSIHAYNLSPRKHEIHKQQKGQPKTKKNNNGPSPSPGPDGNRPVTGNTGAASLPLVLLPVPPAVAQTSNSDKGEETVSNYSSSVWPNEKISKRHCSYASYDYVHWHIHDTFIGCTFVSFTSPYHAAGGRGLSYKCD